MKHPCSHFVMLSEAKHPCTGFLTGVRNDKKKMLAMTKKSVRNDTAFVMLSEAKHPCTGFLALARNDKKKMLAMTKDKCRTVQQNLHLFVSTN